jgi:hypothetical protein
MANYTVPVPYLSVRITTNAVANTTNSNVVVAAGPGVGAAFRIAGFNATIGREDTGVLEIMLHEAGIGQLMWVASLAPGGSSSHCTMLPFPGIQLGANSALQCDNIATIASQTFRLVIWVYTDTLT